MNTKKSGRRRFLKDAALAGLAVGGIRSASGQTQEAEKPEVRTRDLNAYGERSRFVTTARPLAGSDDHEAFGQNPNLLTPLQDVLGITPPLRLPGLSGTGVDYPRPGWGSGVCTVSEIHPVRRQSAQS